MPKTLAPNRPRPYFDCRFFSRTPLFEASWNGHTSTIRILLDARAKIDLGSTGGPCPGRSALMIAALRGMADATAMLLAAGASREATDRTAELLDELAP